MSLLRRLQMPIPERIAVRAQIDTGSHVTGFSHAVLGALSVGPFGRIRLRTPSTKPSEPFFADQYEVSLTLVSGMSEYTLSSVRAIATEDFQQGEEVEAIIGRDILNRYNFQYLGPARRFELFF